MIKTFERVIRRSLVAFLETNNKIDPNQHGSRTGRSTLSQLLMQQDAVLKALEEGENLDTIYLDFAKAFDNCDHAKLKALGVRGRTGRWIYSFLTGRIQKVIVKGRKSKGSILKSGVPQGSVLGPILFLVYISDIARDLTASTLVYVDDTKLRQSIKTEEDVETMQKELDKLLTWGTNNNMEFNGSKFQVIRYGHNEDIKNDTTYFTGDYNEIIERYSSLRDLGVQLQEDATFKDHIENICKKARQKCG